MYSRPSFHSSEPIPRDHTDQPSSPRGPRQQKQKPSAPYQQSSGWSWPRFVSVEVDVEERRRQKKNEAMPVTATAELSRPEQDARNQSFQKAHEHMSHSQPQSEQSRKPDGSDNSNHTTTGSPEGRTQSLHKYVPDVHTSEQDDEDDQDAKAGTKSQEKPDAGQVSLPRDEKTDDLELDATSERVDTIREAELPSKPAEHDGLQQVKRSRRPSTPGTFPRDDTDSVYSQSSLDHRDTQDAQDAQEPSKVTNRRLNYETQGGKAPTSNSQEKSAEASALESDVGPAAEPNSPARKKHLDTTGTQSHEEGSAGALNKGERQLDSSIDPEETSPRRKSHDNVRTVTNPPSQRRRSRGPSSPVADKSQRSPTQKNLLLPIADYAARDYVGSTTEEHADLGSASALVKGHLSPNYDTGNGEVAKAPDIAHSPDSESASTVNTVNPKHVEEKGAPPQYPSHADQEAGPTRATEQPTAIDPDYMSTELYERLIADSGVEGEEAGQEGRTQPGRPRKSISEPAGVVRQVSIPTSIMARRSSKAAKKVTLPPPKIFVQSPSEATQDEPADPYPTPAEPLHNDEYRIISRNGSVVSVQHTVQSATDRLGPRPVRKRKLYVRKVRNLAARPIFLNATLGRKMGRQTKDRLRRLARGEEVPTLPISTKPLASDSPPLRKRRSFVRKVRNVAARPSLMSLAFGRKVAGETKPALRHMAAGDSVVFGEAVDSETRAQ